MSAFFRSEDILDLKYESTSIEYPKSGDLNPSILCSNGVLSVPESISQLKYVEEDSAIQTESDPNHKRKRKRKRLKEMASTGDRKERMSIPLKDSRYCPESIAKEMDLVVEDIDGSGAPITKTHSSRSHQHIRFSDANDIYGGESACSLGRTFSKSESTQLSSIQTDISAPSWISSRLHQDPTAENSGKDSRYDLLSVSCYSETLVFAFLLKGNMYWRNG